MKDYKTLTREKVDVEPGAARYMGETHMMEDWSDKMIGLVDIKGRITKEETK